MNPEAEGGLGPAPLLQHFSHLSHARTHTHTLLEGSLQEQTVRDALALCSVSTLLQNSEVDSLGHT